MNDLSGMVYDDDDEAAEGSEEAFYWNALHDFMWLVQEYGPEQVNKDIASIVPTGTVVYLQ